DDEEREHSVLENDEITTGSVIIDVRNARRNEARFTVINFSFYMVEIVLERLQECPGEIGRVSWRDWKSVLERLEECPGEIGRVSSRDWKSVLERLEECPGEIGRVLQY
ncbi:hypothetical protein BgiBS90_013066, partial [Biomphalaria glabrata]